MHMEKQSVFLQLLNDAKEIDSQVVEIRRRSMHTQSLHSRRSTPLDLSQLS